MIELIAFVVIFATVVCFIIFNISAEEVIEQDVDINDPFCDSFDCADTLGLDDFIYWSNHDRDDFGFQCNDADCPCHREGQ